jgi:DNA-binding PadR family transcriptional regulator
MAVAALDGNAYGFTVRELLAKEAGRKASLGAVHATLYRLQDKRFLASNLDGATEKRGGRRKRLFRLTGAGAEVLHAARASRERMWSLVPPALKPGIAQ